MDLDHRGRYAKSVEKFVPYIGLTIAIVLTFLLLPGTAAHDVAVLAVSAAAVGWMAWGATTVERAVARPVRSTVYYAGLVAAMATLVFLSPFFGFFAFTGYMHAGILPGRLKYAGVVVTAALLSTTQMGGVGNIHGLQTAVYAGIVLVNVLIAGALTFAGIAEEERSRRRAEIIDELAEANRRLKETLEENAGLHAQLVVQAREAGVLDERQRLAGEIHDTIAQGLTGIVRQLELALHPTIAPERGRHHIELAQGLAHQSLREARRSVRALRPPQLDHAQLPDALAELAKQWSTTSGVAAHAEVSGPATPLAPALEVALFRAAQEALANVAKHAKASRAAVTLTYTPDVVVLDVVDDGRGFDPRESTGDREDGSGYGLAAMRQRLGVVGGTLTVESAPGDGTAISAQVPALAGGE